MSFSKCITSCFGFNPEEYWENKRNVLSDWFIHILFYFSLRNYSLKEINNLLWLRAEVRVVQWCFLISHILCFQPAVADRVLVLSRSCSLGTWRPQKSGLPYRQQGPLLWPEGHPQWVSMATFVWFDCLS